MVNPVPGAHFPRLLLLRAADTEGPRDSGNPGLSELGRERVRELRSTWEYADAIASSPLRRAVETASELAEGEPIEIHSALLPIDAERSKQGLSDGGWPGDGSRSPLFVTHASTIRAIVAGLTGEELPDGRPHVGELAVLTRDGSGAWRLGRSSSNPEPLRDTLERTGLLGDALPNGGASPPFVTRVNGMSQRWAAIPSSDQEEQE